MCITKLKLKSVSLQREMQALRRRHITGLQNKSMVKNVYSIIGLKVAFAKLSFVFFVGLKEVTRSLDCWTGASAVAPPSDQRVFGGKLINTQKRGLLCHETAH